MKAAQKKNNKKVSHFIFLSFYFLRLNIWRIRRIIKFLRHEMKRRSNGFTKWDKYETRLVPFSLFSFFVHFHRLNAQTRLSCIYFSFARRVVVLLACSSIWISHIHLRPNEESHTHSHMQTHWVTLNEHVMDVGAAKIYGHRRTNHVQLHGKHIGEPKSNVAMIGIPRVQHDNSSCRENSRSEKYGAILLVCTTKNFPPVSLHRIDFKNRNKYERQEWKAFNV